jgi:cytochrome c oxidase subunit 3
MTVPDIAPPASPARTGVLVGIAAISMTFFALTSALVVRQGSGADWLRFTLPPILYVNTLVLLLSSVTLEMSRGRLARAIGASATGALAPGGLANVYLTLGLGLVFVGGQFLAWRSLAAQGLFLATSPSSGFFYLLTVLHCLHLLGGLGALVYVLQRLRSAAGEVGAAGVAALNALGAAALYWHFVTVLWIYLLFVLFVRI